MPNKRYLLGRKAKLYFSTTDLRLTAAGSAAKTTFLDDAGTQEIGQVGDVALNTEPTWVDGTEREEADGGFESEIRVIDGGEVTFEHRWREQDDTRFPVVSPYLFHELLELAWKNNDQIALVFLDQSRANPGIGNEIVCRGMGANFNVGRSITQAVKDVQRVSVTLKVDQYASWYEEKITGS